MLGWMPMVGMVLRACGQDESEPVVSHSSMFGNAFLERPGSLSLIETRSESYGSLTSTEAGMIIDRWT